MLAEILLEGAYFVGRYQYPLLLVVTIALAAYKLVVQPFFLSALRHIPGPYLHRISHIPLLEAQRKHRWVERVHKLHQQYGDVVVLSPTEISCNGNPRFVNDIYVKNMPKHQFYENFRNHGFKDNIFASLENDRHVRYKRMIQSLYSKSAVFNPKNSTRDYIVHKTRELIDQVRVSSVTGVAPDIINARSELNEHGKGYAEGLASWLRTSGKSLGIDVFSLFGSLAMDVVSAFELGIENGTDLLSDPKKRWILIPHRIQSGMVFWTTRMPALWSWAAGKEVKQASEQVEEWQLSLYGGAEDNVPQIPANQNKSTLETIKKHGIFGKSAYSFLSDNIFAGHETTAVQLTYMCYELSRNCNLHRQTLLRDELRANFGQPGPGDVIDDFDAVDKLPYLEALFQENSRVHTSIPGAEPRVTDKPYEVQIAGKPCVIPAGTGISMQPYSMHRVPEVFPEPDRWNPERWLRASNESEDAYKARLGHMQRYMMPFGKGIRMCLGMNVAVIEMKVALANLYWRFSSSLCEDWCVPVEASNKNEEPIRIGSHYMTSNSDESMMVMVDAYTTRPYHDECWLSWAEA